MSQNVYHTKDNTFKETHKIQNNNNVVILPGDKDSSVIIVHRSDYTKKVESMLQEGISEVLTTECTFSINEQLCKQIDGVPMGSTLFVVLSDCFMNKMDKDVVIPFKPNFYLIFIDQEKEMNQMNYLIK